jgi:hypothetical protein
VQRLLLFLSLGHAYGPITDTMEIITTGKKGKHLNTLERYYIYKTNKENILMNDTHTETYNPIFQAIHELNTVQQPPTSPPQTTVYKAQQ